MNSRIMKQFKIRIKKKLVKGVCSFSEAWKKLQLTVENTKLFVIHSQFHRFFGKVWDIKWKAKKNVKRENKAIERLQRIDMEELMRQEQTSKAHCSDDQGKVEEEWRVGKCSHGGLDFRPRSVELCGLNL